MGAPSRTSVVAAGGLVGGFAAARYTHNRALGGVGFAVAGAWCSRQWGRSTGNPVTAMALTLLYTAAMGGAHPLAKKTGPWPAVLTVTSVVVAASEWATASRPPLARRPFTGSPALPRARVNRPG